MKYNQELNKTELMYLEAKNKQDAFDNNYQAINKTSKLSPIEQMFNAVSSEKTGNVLKQIGYDFFSNQLGSGVNTTGKFGNDYRLSIGERVNIYLYGDSVNVMAISGSNLLTPVIKSEVDSKGNISRDNLHLKNNSIFNLFNSFN